MVLKANELGNAGARSKEDIIKAAGNLASDWIISNTNPDAVRNVVRD